MELHPLPPEVAALLKKVEAAPRLVAHLTVVHDVAVRLTERTSEHWPMLAYEAEAVRMGAAVHDIGKVVFPDELTSPGRNHQAVGAGVLRDWDFPERWTQYTWTHGQWSRAEGVTIEDLLVVLADTLWKGLRDDDLEDRCCRAIAEQCGLDPWRVSLRFYEMTEEIASDGAARVAWEQEHLESWSNFP